MVEGSHRLRLTNRNQRVGVEKGNLIVDSYGETFMVDGIGLQFEETRIFFSGFGGIEYIEVLLDFDLEEKTVSVLEFIRHEPRNFRKINYNILEGGELVVVAEDYHENGVEITISPEGDIVINKYPHA